MRTAALADPAAYVSWASARKATLSDFDPEQLQRLQAAMERRQKAMEALAELMKRTSDTADSTIENLK